jgi:hypothetical protein
MKKWLRQDANAAARRNAKVVPPEGAASKGLAGLGPATFFFHQRGQTPSQSDCKFKMKMNKLLFLKSINSRINTIEKRINFL